MYRTQFSPEEWSARLTLQRLQREKYRSWVAYQQLKAEKRHAKNDRQRRRINDHIRAAKQNYQQARRELQRHKTRQLIAGPNL